MHLRYLLEAGPLWRDEANTVSLSELGTLGELWDKLQYDSFPLLWHLVLRAWRHAGPGEDDAGLRGLGLLVGLCLAGALWLTSHRLGTGPPLVSLPLLGLGAAVIAYGDSLRGYGLGMTTGVLAYGLVWGVVESASFWRVLLALLASLAAVHCLFHNVVVLAACLLAGALVCARRKAWRGAAILLVIGLVAGLSLLPYLGPIRQAGEWNATVKAPVSPWSLGVKLLDTLSLSGAPIPWLWGVLLLVSIILAVLARTSPRASNAEEGPSDRSLYGIVALAVGIAGYAVFLLVLAYPTQPWYYLALLALAAVCVETCLGGLSSTRAGNALRLVASVSLVLVSLPQAWRTAGTRATNVDLVAARIEVDSREGDLVVVSPWYLGVSFQRYYRGAAPWVTVPPVGFHAFHRYDLLQQEMATPHAMTPLLRRLRAVLSAGHRVWWVGEPPSREERGDGITRDAGARRSPWTGADGPFYAAWSAEAGRELRSLSASAEPVRIETGSPVNPFENTRLFVFRTGADPRRSGPADGS